MDIKKLLTDLIEEKNNRYRKGIYGFTQRMLAYNSNKIEGSTLTEEQTASLFEDGAIPASDEYYKAKDVKALADGLVEKSPKSEETEVINPSK